MGEAACALASMYWKGEFVQVCALMPWSCMCVMDVWVNDSVACVCGRCAVQRDRDTAVRWLQLVVGESAAASASSSTDSSTSSTDDDGTCSSRTAAPAAPVVRNEYGSGLVLSPMRRCDAMVTLACLYDEGVYVARDTRAANALFVHAAELLRIFIEAMDFSTVSARSRTCGDTDAILAFGTGAVPSGAAVPLRQGRTAGHGNGRRSLHARRRAERAAGAV